MVLVGKYEAWVTLEVMILTLNWYIGVYVLEICLRELGECASAPRHRSALSVLTDRGPGGSQPGWGDLISEQLPYSGAPTRYHSFTVAV